MPWKVVKIKGRYCVVKKQTLKPVPGGCHSNKAEAVDHMQALYANVKERDAS